MTTPAQTSLPPVTALGDDAAATAVNAATTTLGLPTVRTQAGLFAQAASRGRLTHMAYLAEVLTAAENVLADLETWDLESIESALRTALIDELELKPRHAFGPVRTAVSGRRVSPPLFESLVILGREKALERISQFKAAQS